MDPQTYLASITIVMKRSSCRRQHRSHQRRVAGRQLSGDRPCNPMTLDGTIEFADPVDLVQMLGKFTS